MVYVYFLPFDFNLQMARIVIIEDETILAKSIARSLMKIGHECLLAETAEEGLKLIGEKRPDLVLLDMKLPGMTGLEALHQIKAVDPDILVIIITAHSTVETAVEAMKSGAYDYLQKPLDKDELILIIDRALERDQLKHKLSYYQQKEAEQFSQLKILGECPAIQQIKTFIERISRFDPNSSADLPTVLLSGETGTGKDLVARVIHAKSPFADQPFVEINCTALPDSLIESELFGYEKGAFTDARTSKQGLFEAANGGSIFLNEVGELNLQAQAKLLKVIEQKQVRRLGSVRDRRVNVRIIAATNRDLEKAVQEGKFREDLFYRLKVITIQLPPLRERGEDILLLAEHFLKEFVRKYNSPPKSFSEAAIQAMKQYSWPGNIRELAHVIERAVLLSDHPTLSPANLGLENQYPIFHTTPDNQLQIEFPSTGINLEDVERQLIEKALEITRGNVTEAARKLGIGREALRYRVQKHGIKIG